VLSYVQKCNPPAACAKVKMLGVSGWRLGMHLRQGNHFGCQVTATGASAFRVSAVQPSAAGSSFPLLVAERPIPEPPTPVAVTRHLKLGSLLHLCTGALLRFAPLHCLSLRPSCPRALHSLPILNTPYSILSYLPLSTCPLASLSPKQKCIPPSLTSVSPVSP